MIVAERLARGANDLSFTAPIADVASLEAASAGSHNRWCSELVGRRRSRQDLARGSRDEESARRRRGLFDALAAEGINNRDDLHLPHPDLLRHKESGRGPALGLSTRFRVDVPARWPINRRYGSLPRVAATSRWRTGDRGSRARSPARSAGKAVVVVAGLLIALAGWCGAGDLVARRAGSVDQRHRGVVSLGYCVAAPGGSSRTKRRSRPSL